MVMVVFIVIDIINKVIISMISLGYRVGRDKVIVCDCCSLVPVLLGTMQAAQGATTNEE